MDEKLLGKCGFYCGCCPTYRNNGCKGCVDEHTKGDCYTRDCVLKQGIACCGACGQFPCDTIMTNRTLPFWTRIGCGGRKRVIPTEGKT